MKIEGRSRVWISLGVAVVGLAALAASRGLDTPVSDQGEGSSSTSILESRGFIEVFVTAPDEKPVDANEVTITTASGEVVSTDFGYFPGEAGHYSTEYVPPGRYRVQVGAEGHLDAVTDAFAVDAGTHPDVRVVLERDS